MCTTFGNDLVFLERKKAGRHEHAPFWKFTDTNLVWQIRNANAIECSWSGHGCSMKGTTRKVKLVQKPNKLCLYLYLWRSAHSNTSHICSHPRVESKRVLFVVRLVGLSQCDRQESAAVRLTYSALIDQY
jgi:hypothetical protein